jgi:GT2 family glycosyltransferase
MYVPSARVTHFMGGTIGKDSDISVYYGNRNLLWNVVKNFPKRTLLIFLPWIIGRTCADIPYYMLKGKGRTILKAKVSAIAGIFRMMRKRRNSVQKVPEAEIRKWIRIWRKGHRTN